MLFGEIITLWNFTVIDKSVVRVFGFQNARSASAEKDAHARFTPARARIGDGRLHTAQKVLTHPRHTRVIGLQACWQGRQRLLDFADHCRKRQREGRRLQTRLAREQSRAHLLGRVAQRAQNAAVCDKNRVPHRCQIAQYCKRVMPQKSQAPLVQPHSPPALQVDKARQLSEIGDRPFHAIPLLNRHLQL